MTTGDSPVIRTDGPNPRGARRVGTFDGVSRCDRALVWKRRGASSQGHVSDV